LLIRIFSGEHAKEREFIEAAKHLDALEETYKHKYIKYNLTVYIITLLLSGASLIAGNYFIGEKGLWIGIAISIVIWILSPFAREIIIEKPRMGNTNND